MVVGGSRQLRLLDILDIHDGSPIFGGMRRRSIGVALRHSARSECQEVPATHGIGFGVRTGQQSRSRTDM